MEIPKMAREDILSGREGLLSWPWDNLDCSSAKGTATRGLSQIERTLFRRLFYCLLLIPSFLSRTFHVCLKWWTKKCRPLLKTAPHHFIFACES